MRLWVLIARIRGLLAGERAEREIDSEIRDHLDRLADEHLRRGLSPEHARLAARREFGSVAGMKERYRARLGVPAVETFVQDVLARCG